MAINNEFEIGGPVPTPVGKALVFSGGATTLFGVTDPQVVVNLKAFSLVELSQFVANNNKELANLAADIANIKNILDI